MAADLAFGAPLICLSLRRYVAGPAAGRRLGPFMTLPVAPPSPVASDSPAKRADERTALVQRLDSRLDQQS